MTTETEEILWIGSHQGNLIPRELIISASEKNMSLYQLITSEVNDNHDDSIFRTFSETNKEQYQKIYDLMQKNNINIIKLSDNLFPPNLKKTSDNNQFPIMLYHQGKKFPFVNCIAIVGTRNCSTRAFNITSQISRKLSKLGFTIVTGLARGIDSAAHRAAISEKGKVIGVLPWIYQPYPPEHEKLMEETRQFGCIISENFHQMRKFDKFKFLQRNAVISGISELLIAVESSYTGGTRWQVELALSQGKKVITIEPEQSDKIAYKAYKSFLEKGAKSISDVTEAVEYISQNIKLIKSAKTYENDEEIDYIENKYV